MGKTLCWYISKKYPNFLIRQPFIPTIMNQGYQILFMITVFPKELRILRMRFDILEQRNGWMVNILYPTVLVIR